MHHEAKRKINFHPPPKPWYFNQVLQLLRVSLMLMATFLCQTAMAQEESKEKLALPYNLMDTMPDSNTVPWQNGSCNFLDGAHQGVSLHIFTNDGITHEIRYQLPPGCTHFHALTGVDNAFADDKREFAFTVFGIDADGNKKKLDSKTAHAGGKPQAVDVDLTNIKRLVLNITCTNPGTSNYRVETGYLWWADARLSKDGGPPPPPPLPVRSRNWRKS